MSARQAPQQNQQPKAPDLSIVTKPKITPKQQQMIVLVASGKDLKEVGQIIGCVPSTVWKWKQLSHIASAIQIEIDKIVSQSRNKIKQTLPLAIESLVQAMTIKPGSVAAVRAATVLLQISQITDAEDPKAAGPTKVVFKVIDDKPDAARD